MSDVFGQVEVKSARKFHQCFWCGEIIEKGSPYRRWMWKDGRTIEEIKVHPECGFAWTEAATDEGGFYETMPAEHSRGCRCERGQCECF